MSGRSENLLKSETKVTYFQQRDKKCLQYFDVHLTLFTVKIFEV